MKCQRQLSDLVLKDTRHSTLNNPTATGLGLRGSYSLKRKQQHPRTEWATFTAETDNRCVTNDCERNHSAEKRPATSSTCHTRRGVCACWATRDHSEQVTKVQWRRGIGACCRSGDSASPQRVASSGPANLRACYGRNREHRQQAAPQGTAHTCHTC